MIFSVFLNVRNTNIDIAIPDRSNPSSPLSIKLCHLGQKAVNPLTLLYFLCELLQSFVILNSITPNGFG